MVRSIKVCYICKDRRTYGKRYYHPLNSQHHIFVCKRCYEKGISESNEYIKELVEL